MFHWLVVSSSVVSFGQLLLTERYSMVISSPRMSRNKLVFDLLLSLLCLPLYVFNLLLTLLISAILKNNNVLIWSPKIAC